MPEPGSVARRGWVTVSCWQSVRLPAGLPRSACEPAEMRQPRWRPPREAGARCVQDEVTCLLLLGHADLHVLVRAPSCRCQVTALRSPGSPDAVPVIFRRPALMVAQCQDLDRRRWGYAADMDRLILQVLPVADSDAEELADLAGGLHDELLGVDGASVAPLTAEAAPEGAKGSGMWRAGWWPSSGPWTGCAPW